MQDAVQSFSEMLRAALGERLHAGVRSFVDMLAAEAVMEFPYAPEGLPRRLNGRTAIQAHLGHLSSMIAFNRVGGATVHAGGDPEMVVLEFEGFGRGVSTGAVYEQRYVSLIRLRHGEIVHYPDYWNPLPVLRALRGDAFAETLNVEGYNRG